MTVKELRQRDALRLAKRVYNLDIYEMRNNGTTPEDIAESIRTDPNETIKYLLDIIDELQA